MEQMLNQQGELEGEEVEGGFIPSSLIVLSPQRLLHGGVRGEKDGTPTNLPVSSNLEVRKVLQRWEKKDRDTEPLAWGEEGMRRNTKPLA